MLPGQFYKPIFLYLVIILTLIQGSKMAPLSYTRIVHKKASVFFSIILVLLLAWFLGSRPVSGYYFGDTAQYAFMFENTVDGKITFAHGDGEWIWQYITVQCARYLDVHEYFTVIAVLYIGFSLWACYRLTSNNTYTTFLFILAGLSFFTYGTNGLRNGLACSVVLLFLSYVNGGFIDKIIAAVLAFVAYGIHHTTILPVSMAVISIFVIRSFKLAYTFWIISILVSLVAGSAITSFFATLGFDDRLSYLSSAPSETAFIHTGFRWDFLIYSMMPIVLGYYIIYKRGIRDHFYEILLNTYTLSNAFWVMVIRANFSNRFAYLSWFMYPIVLAYPLLKIDIWGKYQGKYLNRIMLGQIGFTWFMQTFYW